MLALFSFSAPDAAAPYAEGPARQVPGLDALHRMAALLRQAGFRGVELFYAGFTFKGWGAYAPE